jgi:hypothetical protein
LLQRSAQWKETYPGFSLGDEIQRQIFNHRTFFYFLQQRQIDPEIVDTTASRENEYHIVVGNPAQQ